MALQSEYYDPVTNLIHIFQEDSVAVTDAGATGFSLGLEETGFNDVKTKLLSAEYRIRIFSGFSGDTDGKQFSTSYSHSGQLICGVMNKSEVLTELASLSAFTGLTAFPVHVSGSMSQVGLPTSVTKTWKPKKMGFSNEQKIFVSMKGDEFTSAGRANVSLYLRLVRL